MQEESDAAAIVLEGVLDASGASALRKRLLAALDSGLPVALDARGVERVDTAALQVLLAFTRDAERENLEVRWCEPSDSLCSTAVFMDASRLLGLADASPTAES